MLLIAAMLIGISSMWYTNKLAGELAGEEKKRVELWAEAVKHWPNFDVYQSRTDRQIPVVVLDPVAH